MAHKFKVQHFYPGAQEYYHRQVTREGVVNVWTADSLYKEAEVFENERIFVIQRYEPRARLKHLISEVSIRLKITANEVFRIGEILIRIKKECSEQNIRYNLLLKICFGFEYETGQNFIHVYEYCMGYKSIALRVKPSILYKIAAKNIEPELREWLFLHGNLDKITHGRLKNLISLYRSEGMEAVRKTATEIQHNIQIANQLNYLGDLAEDAYQKLRDNAKKMVSIFDDDFVPFEKQLKGLEPEAAEISSELKTAIYSACELVEEALKKYRLKMYGIEQSINKKLDSDANLPSE